MTNAAARSELFPGVALGVADGADRATTLEHLSTCGECREELAELSAIRR
jgi:hypothetical protein